jgi:hypothetical protein
MESNCSLCTFKVPPGANNLILCTLDTIHRLLFVTRLIINQINKVQWMDYVKCSHWSKTKRNGPWIISFLHKRFNHLELIKGLTFDWNMFLCTPSFFLNSRKLIYKICSCHNWNTTKVGFKHQSINQFSISSNMFCSCFLTFTSK